MFYKILSEKTGLDVNSHGGIIVSENGATTKEGVYAGGDAVTGAATVILAMGAGKAAAAGIDEYLKNRLKTPNTVTFNELIEYLNAFITCK